MSSPLAVPQSEADRFELTSQLPASNTASRSSSTIIGENDRPLSVGDREDVNEEYRREAYGPEPGEKGWDEFEVRFAPDDPDDPHTWSRVKRWYLTALSGLLVLNATFASSIPAGIIPHLMAEFHFGTEVGALLISLFVAGYCVGPILWGPLSEQYGRRPIALSSFAVYTCFQVGCALSKNTASILVFRFLGGTFAAAPLTNSGGIISDIWDADTRGLALAFFTLAPFAGPSLGPTVGGFMVVAGVSWRWVFWLLTMFAGVCFRAKRLRKQTGDSRWWAPLEKEDLTITQRLETIVARPFKILILEPMLLSITLYMSFVYGCLYLMFEAYPIVFTVGHHLNAGLTGLTFLPIFVGGCIGCFGYILYWNPIYIRLSKQYAPAPVPPEFRLDICMYAGPGFALTFFWFGWTSYPEVSLWAPMMSGLVMGFSVVWIFLGLFNYLIDAYLFIAASALASTTVIRSLFGAGFPLFANQMYEKLNPRWASTLLGCIALLMTPIPFVLKHYGPTLRRNSKFAPSVDVLPKFETKETENSSLA
ncbi:unnamed protein product [Somion occarium]|uniref:Major facilitator superfamily (MFS) profile domain-containing protein n=1 Tax=Somion occarium TaxID=3059160 RepID=A0ABP1CKV1_9APHY